MKIALCYCAFENVGLESLSAVLRQAGHETRLFFDPMLFDDCYVSNERLARAFSFRERVARDVAAWQPDLVGFGVVGVYMGWAADVAARVKARWAAPIVFGGIHPSSVPDEVLALPAVDWVIRGEGETALLELVEHIEGKRGLDEVGNLAFQGSQGLVSNPLRPLIQDLDSLPFPDKELFYREHSLFRQGYLASTMRGCTNACPFCHNQFEKQLYGVGNEVFVRRMSVERAVEEIAWAKRRHGIDYVRYGDDTFTLFPRWLERFADLYPRRAGVPFWCFVRPDTVTPDIVRCLKEAGCTEVQIGVQSIDQQIRMGPLKRRETNEQIADTIHLFRDAGIAISTDNILNLPDHSMAHLEEMARFYLEHPPSRINTYWIAYYPELELTQRAHAMGVLDDGELQDVRQGRRLDALERGGSKFDPALAPMQTLFMLQDLLPPRAIRALLDRGWHRRLPFLGMMPTFFLQYAASYGKNPDGNDVFARRLLRRYPGYMARLMRG
jgi:anaerobic magnesium-protoporphyrin IX monomethyl ester cyclase